jgi:hypothetical protein
MADSVQSAHSGIHEVGALSDVIKSILSMGTIGVLYRSGSGSRPLAALYSAAVPLCTAAARSARCRTHNQRYSAPAKIAPVNWAAT